MKLCKNFIGIIYFIYFVHFQYIKCSESSQNFKIYWTIPTFRCKNYGINFDDILQNASVIQNSENLDKSNQIVIFNNPQLLDNVLPEKMGNISYVYLQTNDIRQKIYSTFEGLGVLNYTKWQPIFRQNCGSLENFYNSSIDMEKELYPLLNENQTRELAEMRFEFATSSILIESIKKIKNTWPVATWGLFDYPKCSNQLQAKLSPECNKEVMEDNDKLSWLWKLDIALFPSLFVPIYGSFKRKKNYVEARLKEAKRISQKYNPPLKIYPYLSLSYDDYEFLISKEELINILTPFFTIKTDGLIIGGSENYVNNDLKCTKLHEYVEKKLQPILKEFLSFIQNETNVISEKKQYRNLITVTLFQ